MALTFILPFMKVIYCRPPFPPRNGFIIGSCTNTLGSVCSFGCKEGYILQNGATIRKCLLKAPDQILGYWNGSEPTCKGKCDIFFLKYPVNYLEPLVQLGIITSKTSFCVQKVTKTFFIRRLFPKYLNDLCQPMDDIMRC